jgi:site-specific recombinase XerD
MPLESASINSKSVKVPIPIPIVYRVTSAGLAQDTRQHYERDISRFLAHFHITDIEPLKEYSLPHCKQMIIDYVIHLRESEKLSRKSIRLHLSAIRHFFFMIREDEFPIKWHKINIELPPNEYAHRDRGYSVEEIQKMLESGCQGRFREKAVILLLTSAGGMRVGGIPRLKRSDLKEMRTSTGEKTYFIRVYSDSSEDYTVPCSPECADILDQYFSERERDGEKINGDSPVIRNLYNSLSVQAKAKPLSLEGIKYIVRKAVKLSGIRNDFEFKGQVKLTRGFRKYYKSEADLSGMLPATVELTQGHNIGIPGHYLRLKDTEILQDYEKVIERVSFDPNHRLKKRVNELETGQAQEINRLKIQLEEKDKKLRQTVEALEIKSKNSIDRIEKEIIKLRNGVIVGEMTTDHLTGTHCYKYKDLNGNDLPRDKDKMMI